MKQLIINADDFGLHEAVNAGIITGHASGCITSTSLMPTGAAFDAALTQLQKHRRLDVGVHLTLVGGEVPLSDPAKIPTLVDAAGRLFPDYLTFLRRFSTGRIMLDDIRTELTAQVRKVIAAGVPASHLDSHQHLHIVPGIIDIAIDLARQFHISAMRLPAEPLLFRGGYPVSGGRLIGRTGLTVLARLAWRKARRAGIFMPDHFFGMLAGGNMQEQYLCAIIRQLPAGTTEIMLHPGSNDAALQAAFGWPYHWQAELAAVSSDNVKSCLRQHDVQLISFRDLRHG